MTWTSLAQAAGDLCLALTAATVIIVLHDAACQWRRIWAVLRGRTSA